MSTILFVDDHHCARTVFAEILRSAGHFVLEAGTVAEAERLAERQAGPIDLLIVEAVLTTTNGLEIAHRLQSLYPEMRALFVSEEPAGALSDEGPVAGRSAVFNEAFYSRRADPQSYSTNRSPCGW